MTHDSLSDRLDQLAAELDRHRGGLDQWRTLAERLVDVDPFTGTGCLWCGIDAGEHLNGCAWADAREALDLPA